MTIKKKNNLGQIQISNEAIASVVADAALECYGVVGLANKTALRNKISKILTKKEYSKGVIAYQDPKNAISISLYIVIAYGCKVTEVLSEVQKKVKYVLEKTFDSKVKKVNVYAQSLLKVE